MDTSSTGGVKTAKHLPFLFKLVEPDPSTEEAVRHRELPP